MIWILQIIILLYCVCIAVRIIQLQKYNPQVELIHITDNDELVPHLLKLSPILLYEKNKELPTLDESQTINYNSESIPLSRYRGSCESLFIYRDETLDISEQFIDVSFFPESSILLPHKRSLSVIQGNHTTSIQRNIHNYLFLETVDGYSTIYLINPRFKDTKEDYKEIGYQLILQPKTRLYIPPNWYYVQEIDEKLLQYHIEIDDIFTCVPNFLKKKLGIV